MPTPRKDLSVDAAPLGCAERKGEEMKIKVRKTHIKRGTQKDACSCPVALALKESLGLTDVRVNVDDVKIGRIRLDLPSDAQTFIAKFDRDKKSVQPFVLEI